MPPPAPPPADPAPPPADAEPTELIPGHIPFPPVVPGETPDVVDARAHAHAPPRLYPALPRGLKPFEPPTREERRLLAIQNAVRAFCRASARHHGARDDARERRAREGDVARWLDDVAEDEEEAKDKDENDEDDGTEEDEEASDSSQGVTEKWIERFRKSRQWETFRVTDESIVPREIYECAFPEDDDEDEGDDENGEEKRGKKRAASGDDANTRSSKRGRATASGSVRIEDGGAKTKMKDGFSRLERLVQLESRAAAEGAGRRGRDGDDDDDDDDDDGRGQRSGRASARRSTRDRSRSLSRNPRRGGGGGDDDDGDDEKFGDDDDELESDDDYGQGANFDDDEGYDDDAGDGNAEAYF